MNYRNVLGCDTFSITARCERTGMMGIGITTKALCVSARCPHVKPRVGAISTQSFTDPRTGLLGMKLLEMGYSAPKVMKEIKDSDPYIEYRQISVVDKDGNTMAHTGSKNRDWAGHVVKKNFITMGNCLTGEQVVKAMADAFESSADEALEERLLQAIEAGRDAGGQIGGHLSSGLLVYDWEVFPRVSLRVDHHREPIKELRRIFELYKPLIPYYSKLPSDPSIAEHSDDWLRSQGKEDILKQIFFLE